MDSLNITALDVGHGDAFLIQWKTRQKEWTCLIDGGSSFDRLYTHLTKANVKKIDLLVLSHLDSDHVGGLIGLADKINIATYWGPALPAFKRHLWLFGELGVKAIERCTELEESLKRKGVDICYPLEGYSAQPIPDLGAISILSPAARLVKRLLTDDDVADLFTQQPMPLGWLTQSSPKPTQEETNGSLTLDAAFARNFLTPDDLGSSYSRNMPDENERKSLVREWSKRTGLEPEYFGDSALNNTSLVLYLNLSTDGRFYSSIFPGDQENWTYLFARNPRGLQADVLKASHHGGRVYIEFSVVQPKVVLMSANGQHGLPRNIIRNAAVRWGAFVFCTSPRKGEIIIDTSKEKEEDCCHAALQCNKGTRNVSIIMDSTGIRSDVQACHSGLGRQSGPVIQVRQHIIQPSPIMGHLFENELRKHIGWIKASLESIHKERLAVTLVPELGYMPVKEEDLANLARANNRAVIVPHLREVLDQGMRRNEFWATPTEPYHHYRTEWQCYASPRKDEIERFIELLSNKLMILFPMKTGCVPRDPDSLVNSLQIEGLSHYANKELGFPSASFHDVLWPSVLKAFKKAPWHCYVNKGHGFAFSTVPDVKILLTRLVNALLSKNTWGSYSLTAFEKGLPFNFVVFVSDNAENLESFIKKPLFSDVNEWLTCHVNDFTADDWRKDDINNKLGYCHKCEGHTIRLDELLKDTDGDVDLIVELLARSANKIW
jgi:beta-lactamase superfamily II metal-dependent hydrolase